MTPEEVAVQLKLIQILEYLIRFYEQTFAEATQAVLWALKESPETLKPKNNQHNCHACAADNLMGHKESWQNRFTVRDGVWYSG